MKYLRRSRKGAVLVEFTFTALALVVLLMVTIEFGLEVFRRQATERAAGAAASAYATSMSLGLTRATAEEKMPVPFRSCLDAPEITLHNNLASLKNGSGRTAQGNASDAGGRLARIDITCRWTRITPPARTIFGAEAVHQSTTFVRIR